MDVLVGAFRVWTVPVKRYSLRYPNITIRDWLIEVIDGDNEQ
jgi:hypothetical protein